MKPLATIAVLLFASMSAFAQSKPCEELKAEVAKKLEANGVKSYTLEIVSKDKQGDGKNIGTCEGGSKKLLYSKTPAPAKKA